MKMRMQRIIWKVKLAAPSLQDLSLGLPPIIIRLNASSGMLSDHVLLSIVERDIVITDRVLSKFDDGKSLFVKRVVQAALALTT